MEELMELTNSSLEEDTATATATPAHLFSRPTTVFAAVAASLFTVVGVVGTYNLSLARAG